MSGAAAEEAQILKLTLHERLVGYLIGFHSGHNALVFADEFRRDPYRPTFSLVTHPDFPRAETMLAAPWGRRQRLHPVLSNLLPEGALRQYLAESLAVHIDDEFSMLAHLGDDLPGALVAEPLDPQAVPEHILAAWGHARPVKFAASAAQRKFSLAGVQMKFSMKAREGRYTFRDEGELGDWIIKTPSSLHRHVPANEYTAMTLAERVGVDTPEIRLVDMDELEGLPDIPLPPEDQAFAIKRFDREGNRRIHMEDFAQVLVKYPHDKYRGGNYGQIGEILYRYSGDGLADIQQLARRLLVNILLANGDAHLKNWSLLYRDAKTPRLAPAYDIVTTSVYIENEREFALNLARTKRWYEVTSHHFEKWADRVGVPWRAIRPHLNDVMEKARTLWPTELNHLPMDSGHKKRLREHWNRLHPDFRIQ